MARVWPALTLTGADDLVLAALHDAGVAAIEEQPDALRVVFHKTSDRDAGAAALRRQFPNLQIDVLDVPDEDWAARSQANLRAVRVGGITIAPPWDADAHGSGLLIVIEPSMGFGTGHHATTRLCLEALQRLDLTGLTVVDVGTGSGVLAIAAASLNADTVIGVDDDPDAVQAARDNVAVNEAAVQLVTSDLRQASLPVADVVLANLTGGLLVAASSSLLALARPAGRLILSGFLEEEEAGVLAAYDADLESRDQEGEWVCVTLRRRIHP